MLLHQPFGDVFSAWRGLTSLYNEGKIRAIGISNFYVDHMVEFCGFSGTGVLPMVNQKETHPLNQQIELME